jgi:hypothetical protein
MEPPEIGTPEETEETKIIESEAEGETYSDGFGDLDLGFEIENQPKPLDINNITGVFVDIASRRHMCDTCYGTYKYDMSGDRGMLHGILTQLGFKISSIASEEERNALSKEDSVEKNDLINALKGKYDNFVNNLNYEFLISGSIDHGK